jgi:exodeoxyribonuclease VII large subunit
MLQLVQTGLVKLVSDKIATAQTDVRQLPILFSKNSQLLLERQKISLYHIARNVDNMSPANVLKRGYSITTYQGKAISSISNLGLGDTVKTFVADGNFMSKISNINPNNND